MGFPTVSAAWRSLGHLLPIGLALRDNGGDWVIGISHKGGEKCSFIYKIGLDGRVILCNIEHVNKGDTEMTKTFEPGKQYSMRSPCDHECVWTYKVLKRTAKQVTLVDRNGEEKRCGIRVWNGEEVCSPLGRYSMSPVLSA